MTALAKHPAAGKIAAPAPGIYQNVSFEEYLAWNAISNSRLGQLAKSPAHFKACVELAKSRSLMIGQLAHAGRFEPLAIAQRYAVMPPFHLDPENINKNGEPSSSKATRYCQDKEAAFEQANADKQVVPADWYEEVVAIVTAVHADQEASSVLNGVGDIELSIVWDDPPSGIRCKARLDKLNRSRELIVDLKTTSDLLNFPKAIANYGYHRQMAHYFSGWHALTGLSYRPWIVAVENQPPYCVQAAPLHDETLAAGFSDRRWLMNLLATCIESDCWPGPKAPASWLLPAWAENREPVDLIVGGQAVSL